MNEQNEDDEVIIEFKAVPRAILDFLKHGEIERAIHYMEETLNDK